jgi:hypothetical protein
MKQLLRKTKLEKIERKQGLLLDFFDGDSFWERRVSLPYQLGVSAKAPDVSQFNHYTMALEQLNVALNLSSEMNCRPVYVCFFFNRKIIPTKQF